MPFVDRMGKVSWASSTLHLPDGMEIDLGSIGKEYAVDKVFSLIEEQFPGAFLVNFGGDLRASGRRKQGQPWQVGVEKLTRQQSVEHLELSKGAMATSGDSRRFLLKDNIRYGHFLDPKTGWPILDAPRSVTALAPTCIEAGVFSSLASMMEAEAESFLTELNVTHWCVR